MVPEVISTLKTFFGRPDQILDRLIQKAKRFSVNRDRLDSLIDYALAVRNICATMEACQLDAHLKIPMLVRELVDKLPNQYKLNWAMHPNDGSIANGKAFSDWLYKIAKQPPQSFQRHTQGRIMYILIPATMMYSRNMRNRRSTHTIPTDPRTHLASYAKAHSIMSLNVNNSKISLTKEANKLFATTGSVSSP